MLAHSNKHALLVGRSRVVIISPRRKGLVLFAIGVIMFLGQGYLFTILNIVASLFIAPGSAGYEMLSQSYLVVNALAIIFILSGVVMFYSGRRENTKARTSSSATTQSE